MAYSIVALVYGQGYNVGDYILFSTGWDNSEIAWSQRESEIFCDDIFEVAFFHVMNDTEGVNDFFSRHSNDSVVVDFGELTEIHNRALGMTCPRCGSRIADTGLYITKSVSMSWEIYPEDDEDDYSLYSRDASDISSDYNDEYIACCNCSAEISKEDIDIDVHFEY